MAGTPPGRGEFGGLGSGGIAVLTPRLQAWISPGTGKAGSRSEDRSLGGVTDDLGGSRTEGLSPCHDSAHRHAGDR